MTTKKPQRPTRNREKVGGDTELSTRPTVSQSEVWTEALVEPVLLAALMYVDIHWNEFDEWMNEDRDQGISFDSVESVVLHSILWGSMNALMQRVGDTFGLGREAGEKPATS